MANILQRMLVIHLKLLENSEMVLQLEVFLQELIFQPKNLVKVLLIRAYSFQCQLIYSLLKTTEEDHLEMDIDLLQEMVDLSLEPPKTSSQSQPLSLSTTINKSFLNVSYRRNIL